MGNAQDIRPGMIAWVDLTVGDAESIQRFYSDVVGWSASPVDMGGYADFSMNEPQSEQAVAGVCHARGANAGLPPHWLIYITVDDLDHSMARCKELGGEVIVGPKGGGSVGRYCVIRDPAGAFAALIQPQGQAEK